MVGQEVVVERDSTEQAIDVYIYGKESCQRVSISDAEQLSLLASENHCLWANINKLDQDLINSIGYHYNLHEIVLEDIFEASQRSKVDDQDSYILITVKLPHYDEADLPRISLEQVSLLVFPNIIISFQEFAGDVFDDVRRRLQKNTSRIRKSGVDYLLYALLSSLIDAYVNLTDQLSNQTDALESALIAETSELSLNDLYQVKRDMMTMRKALQPLRDILTYLSQGDMSWIAKRNLPFFKDCHEQVTRTLDSIELQRDVIASVFDVYLSTQNNRMSEVMKVMAIFATIFIPLTFITGLYGMNFEYMPGVKWHAGFYAILTMMGAVVVALIAYFKKRQWF